jgi:hypothetical protein
MHAVLSGHLPKVFSCFKSSWTTWALKVGVERFLIMLGSLS